MKRTQHVIAAVVVATALCADRVAPAAPQSRPQPTASLARTIVTRLTTNLRRAVSTMRLLPGQVRGQVAAVVTRVLAPVAPAVALHASAAMPFRFRLPPPVA